MADGQIPAYVARLAKPGKHSVILGVQEIFGVHEHIKDMCRRFAKLGYYAIAPELFARQGDVSTMSDIGTILSEVVAKVPDAQVCAELDTLKPCGFPGRGSRRRCHAAARAGCLGLRPSCSRRRAPPPCCRGCQSRTSMARR